MHIFDVDKTNRFIAEGLLFVALRSETIFVFFVSVQLVICLPSVQSMGYTSDILALDGVGGSFVLDVAAELGFTLHQFPSAKHFTSWLGLAPNRKVSGGKLLSSSTPKKQNKAATAFRQAANAIGNCKQHSLKAFFCAILKRQGRKGAITAIARKLAVIYYNMVTKQQDFDYQATKINDDKYRKATLEKIQKSINELNISIDDLKFSA